MSYKTIVVHMDGAARSAARLPVAFHLAETYRAHVVGVFGSPGESVPSHALAEGGAVIAQIAAKRTAEAHRGEEDKFRAAMRDYAGVSAEWRADQQGALSALFVSARYADLVVAGQGNPDTNETPGWFLPELVLGAGRPVLVVPYAGRFGACGNRVLVAWNATREAARAVTDALPILQRAESVDVVTFDPRKSGGHGEMPGADVALYLARHGVKVTASRQEGMEIDVGMQILSRAADTDADLIVMGAYGHSRVRELVLGGVTRTLLESMTVPVLMSH